MVQLVQDTQSNKSAAQVTYNILVYCRAKIKIAAPRALQFQDNTEVSSCMELSESTALAN